MIKKESGSSSVGNIIVTLITIIVVGIMVVATMGYMSNYSVRNDIDVVAREYILRMETEGYLTADMKADLVSALTEIGVTDIVLDGTTESEVSYGEQIVLCITGKVQLRSYSVTSLFGLEEKYEWNEFTLQPKCSTSKH